MGSDLIVLDHPAVSICLEYFNSRVLEPLSKSKANCWLAGGCIRDWFTDRRVNSDFDVWFKSPEDLELAKSAAVAAGWVVTVENDSSVNFTTERRCWVQFVKKHYFDSVEDTLKVFDFTVCCAATDGKSIVVHKNFFVDLAMRRLAFANKQIVYPVSSFKRSSKYQEKGFKFCPDEQNKLLLAMKEELEDFTIEEVNARYME